MCCTQMLIGMFLFFYPSAYSIVIFFFLLSVWLNDPFQYLLIAKNNKYDILFQSDGWGQVCTYAK